MCVCVWWWRRRGGGSRKPGRIDKGAANFAKSWKTTHQRQDLKEIWNMNGRGSGDKMGKEGFRQREWHECTNVRHA